MYFAGFTAGEWLLLVQHELLLFASLFFFLGAVDELAVDRLWLWLKLRGRLSAEPLRPDAVQPREFVRRIIRDLHERVRSFDAARGQFELRFQPHAHIRVRK